jgi:F-type H+-transporting ATPase subunit delta
MSTVVITTAVPLTSAQLEHIKKAVDKKYGKGAKYHMVVSEAIVGGVQITINSRQLDGSVKYKLAQIKKKLLEEIVREA